MCHSTLPLKRAVVVALPLGVLKHAGAPRFTPPLADWKQRAMRGVGFGMEDKIALRFDKVVE
jgi:polyamine oxidase